MNIDMNIIDIFLKKHCMHPDCIDLNGQLDIFVLEMEKGLVGLSEGSMMMLPSYITIEGNIPINESIIVIDAGGTNLRVALVSFNEKKQSSIDYVKRYPMPGTNGTITFEEMCDTIIEYIHPIVGLSNRIVICFSFPAEILPNKDARIIAFNKEVQIYDAKGKILGESLHASMKRFGITESKHVVVINDTIATLLGAFTAYPDRAYDSYVGFVLGTGTNICYIEQIKKMSKLCDKGVDLKSMVINTEYGGFNKLPRGTVDIKIDYESFLTGDMVLEKMIAGAYLSSIVLLTTQLAVSEGLFSISFENKLKNITALPINEIEIFCDNPFKDSILKELTDGCDSDRIKLYTIIDRIVERAAKITTLALAAVVKKTGYGLDPTIPLCISTEGTTFKKLNLYRSKLNYHVKDFIIDTLGYYVEFVEVENATIIGSAVAGVLN